MCQSIGLPPISTIGFGRVEVSSLNREPRPPARITAFTGARLSKLLAVRPHAADRAASRPLGAKACGPMSVERQGVERDDSGREVDSNLAWLAAVPAAALALFAIILLGPPLGSLLFPVETGGFWPAALGYVRPEGDEEARYLLALLAAVLVPLFVLWVRGRVSRPAVPRALAFSLQLVFVAVLVLAVFCRRGSVHLDISYFNLPTIIVALAICEAFTAVLIWPSTLDRIGALLSRRSFALTCGALFVAALATAIWLLPALQRDSTIGYATHATEFDLQYTFDEGLSVINGHTPLVNYVAQYGSLWPYVIAIPMHFGHGSLAAFTISMAFITLLTMLAVYAVIRRVVGSPIAALFLFLPFMATSFFLARGTPVKRYSFADYFGAFPLRYAGPYFVLFLLARHLTGSRPRRAGWIFLVAGLAVMNNTDFGIPALGATAIAVVAAADEPRTRRWWSERFGEAVAGLIGAFLLVSIVTVARTGDLPNLGLAFRYAHLIGLAGYYLLPMPWFGFWVAIYLTFCAALTVAALLISRSDARRIEIGTLVWIGIFGLGAGAYYTGRSNSEVLIALFSSWALAVVLLLAVLTRDLVRRGKHPSPAHLALFAGFGLLVCSLAQFPAPWRSVERLERHGPEIFEPTGDAQFVAANTKPGEPVVLLTNLGQRISREAGVDDVTPYSGVPSMPTKAQLTETLEHLREEGGTKVFFREAPENWPELVPALEHLGFRQIGASEPAAPEGQVPPDRIVLLSDAGATKAPGSGG
jgi:hypothetical protein